MPSFDIVSKTDIPEVDNAIQGAMREIGTRFDFKGSQCSISRIEGQLVLIADDDLKLRQLKELIQGYLAKRKVDVGSLMFNKPEAATGNTLKQTVDIKQGLDRDLTSKIIKEIKSQKLKVQMSIQGDELRVTGKKRDQLQDVISLTKSLNIRQPLQFVNFRD
ncbi:MAG: YajQ family cyclic di-GMP-binding protein [Alphaproteobacteria bacterium]|jgi:uncharacterized protein YajQ (UPF0234 family)|nr:YajQ family cyclic di-GMP-binding protein [Alphaproteobacteria bacterium]PPR14255.1 MAG: hypothetical protein CFH42_00007 [Alphaproteobacteria bacterium MarineAlpha12_Bin1]|tara:strand:- start:5980 stop:6465 length:486 start_codon:yes stop_codon:yes gene_type:complete